MSRSSWSSRPERAILRAFVAAVALAAGPTRSVAQNAVPEKAPLVTVTGCLKAAGPDSWVLVNATEPVASPEGPVRVQLGDPPPPGRKRFALIGVALFNLPSKLSQTVVVQGLLIKASPESRLNVTSVAKRAATCSERSK
jgi:hypothetical protein